MNELTEIMVKNICPKNVKKNYKIRTITKIDYKNCTIILYGGLENSLFDINHIIQILDQKDPRFKYMEFKDRIIDTCLVKNEYGGYYIKEFVNEGSMFDIILSSTSDFSKRFKKDVSNILVELRKNGFFYSPVSYFIKN